MHEHRALQSWHRMSARCVLPDVWLDVGLLYIWALLWLSQRLVFTWSFILAVRKIRAKNSVNLETGASYASSGIAFSSAMDDENGVMVFR